MTVIGSPSWEMMLPVLLAALQCDLVEDKKTATECLRRMAATADAYDSLLEEYELDREAMNKTDNDFSILMNALMQIYEGAPNPIEISGNALNKMTCAGNRGL